MGQLLRKRSLAANPSRLCRLDPGEASNAATGMQGKIRPEAIFPPQGVTLVELNLFSWRHRVEIPGERKMDDSFRDTWSLVPAILASQGGCAPGKACLCFVSLFFFSSDKFLSISNLFCFSWRVLVCFFWPTTTPNCRQMLIDVPCSKTRMWQHVEAATIAGIPPWLPWFPIIIEPSLTGGFGWKGILLLSLLWWRLCCSRWHIKGTNPSLQNSLAHKTKLSRELSTLFQFSQNANFIKFPNWSCLSTRHIIWLQSKACWFIFIITCTFRLKKTTTLEIKWAVAIVVIVSLVWSCLIFRVGGQVDKQFQN